MKHFYQRTELFLGHEAYTRLSSSTIMVVGLGGVGGMAAEALARSGVGTLVLVDDDDVDITNVNRQLIALPSTVGQMKATLFEQRIHQINPKCKVLSYTQFWNSDQPDWLTIKPDFVIDAIDTLSAKVRLYRYCLLNMIPFISSGGMANRIDPTKLIVASLASVTHDSFAKMLRKICRKNDVPVEIVKIVISKEEPRNQLEVINEEGATRKQKMPPSSMMMVPATAGLILAAQAVEELCQLKK